MEYGFIKDIINFCYKSADRRVKKQYSAFKTEVNDTAISIQENI